MEWLRWILLAIGVILIGVIYVAGRRQQVPRSDEDFPEASFGPAADSGRARGAGSARPYFADAPADAEAEGGVPAETPEYEETVDPAADFAMDPSARVEAPVEPDPGPEPAAIDPEPDLEPGRDAEPERELEPSSAPEPEGRSGREPRSRSRGADPVSEPERLVLLYVLSREGQRLVGAQLAATFERLGLEHGELGAFHARVRDGRTDEAGRPATEFSVANVLEPGSFDFATMDTLSTPGVVLFIRLPGPPAPMAAFERMVVAARDLARDLDARVLDERRTPLTRQSEQLLRDELQQLVAKRPEHGG